MELPLTVKVRKPRRVLNHAWLAYLDKPGVSSRGIETENCIVETTSGCIILAPQYEPEKFGWGKHHYLLYPDAAGFNEGTGAFGDRGNYVGWAGDPNVAWEAYLSDTAAFGDDVGVAFCFYWFPPPNAFMPALELFPRVDFSLSADLGGVRYYFAPLILAIDSRARICIYEYEYDSILPFIENPARQLTQTAEVPLNYGPGLMSGWFTVTVIPIEPDGFVLLSPAIRGGGYVYYSQIQRSQMKLFCTGSAGIRSLSGGMSMFSIIPVTYPMSGTVTGPVMAKWEEDDKPVRLSVKSWTPEGTTVTGNIVDTDKEPIGPGAAFGEFRYRLQLTSDGTRTPVVYNVQCDIAGDVEERSPKEVDISSDVVITERISEELGDYRATIRLRNLNGKYNHLIWRPMNEIDLDFNGKHRAIVYTTTPSVGWWPSPTAETLWVEWECQDGWGRLERQLIAKFPAYDGLDLKSTVTDFLKRLGYPDEAISIADEAASIKLPTSRGTNNPLFKPEDGSEAGDFLRQLHERLCSTWIMGFNGEGVFELKPPPNPLEEGSVKYTYYLSRQDAQEAYEEEYRRWDEGLREDEPKVEDFSRYIYGETQVRFNYDTFKNEIWVIGWNDALQCPLAVSYVDRASQVDENYPFYVGERRLAIIVTRFNRLDVLYMVLNQAVLAYSRLRRTIRFTTKFDPDLRPGDFIKIHGVPMIFRVLSTSTEIGPETWGRMKGEVHSCEVEAIEWPVS